MYIEYPFYLDNHFNWKIIVTYISNDNAEVLQNYGIVNSLTATLCT